jgi:hypothetical protein
VSKTELHHVDYLPVLALADRSGGFKLSSIRSCILSGCQTGPPAMEETAQAEARRTSDLLALAIYSVAVFLLMLAWAA